MVPFFQRIPQADPLMLVGYRGDFQTLKPHETLETKSNLFAGAKILSLLDAYEKTQKAAHFDLAVDFGWFYFLTKPIFYALTWLKDLTGNFGLAILLFTVLLKLLFFPLANKSYHAMARMKRFQPMMEEIRTRYKDDPARLNQETMNFYKKNKINPVSGCLPMLLQIPAFFALYKVLFISIEMRHAPFLGWIHDLSAPDPTNFFTLFGLIPWTPPAFLHLGIWPLFMGCSMVLQQKLNPPPVDPIQRKMFQYVMPLVFTFMLGQFASGLVIYWTWNNLLSVLQQWLIMRSDLKRIEPGVKQSKK
jgi:YidC/Oxa1 family membrane protein insertase